MFFRHRRRRLRGLKGERYRHLSARNRLSPLHPRFAGNARIAGNKQEKPSTPETVEQSVASPGFTPKLMHSKKVLGQAAPRWRLSVLRLSQCPQQTLVTRSALEGSPDRAHECLFREEQI